MDEGRNPAVNVGERERLTERMWQGPAFAIEHPASGELPLVVASPHSGDAYPEDMLAAAALNPHDLRRSEDCYVDELVGEAARLGAVAIRALFPRAYVDANREPYELDPQLFDEPLPDYANSRSPRVAAGLGTIARVVANGQAIYRGRMRVAEALERIERCYIPYHKALRAEIERLLGRFGFCLLLDCHSMPTLPASPRGEPAAEVVLGDCHGTTASGALVELVLRSFRGLGYRVAYNSPYAGGFITRQYGRPERGVLALQIELARGLYMDEESLHPSGGFAALRSDLGRVLGEVAGWTAQQANQLRAAE